MKSLKNCPRKYLKILSTNVIFGQQKNLPTTNVKKNYPSWIHWQDIDPPELKLHDALHSASIEYSAQIILWWFSQLSLPKGSNVTFNIRSTFVSEFFEDAMACNCKTTGDKIVPTTSLRLRYKIVLSGVSWKTWLESIWLVVLLMFEL